MLSHFDDKKEEKQVLGSDNQKLDNIQIIDQKLIERYYSYFEKELSDQLEESYNKYNFIDVFAAKGIKYNPHSSRGSCLSLELIEESLNSQVAVINMTWGQFSMNLRLLSVLGKSRVHQHNSDHGVFGNVYRVALSSRPFVIKCITFAKLRDVGEALFMAVKECFLLRIAAALGVGSQISQAFGFDLVLHSQCVEFAIEVCEKIDEMSTQTVQHLKQALFLLHHFGFAHFDIKPENIMYSPTFKKAVFIDFGLSELVQARVGQTTPTFFRGTLLFCSQQMVAAFEAGGKRQVDVFYNDICCLQASLKMYNEKKYALDKVDDPCFGEDMGYENPQIIKHQSKNHPILLLYAIKFHLYNHSTKSLVQLFQHNISVINRLYIPAIMEFLGELEPCKEIRHFYQNYLKSHKKQSIEFAEVHNIYSSKFSEFKIIRPNQIKQMAHRQHYRNILGLTDRDDCQIFTEEKVWEMFNLPQSNRLSIQIYFSLYIRYVSYSNNVFGVSQQKRRKLTYLFRKNGYVERVIVEQTSESTLALVTSTILLIFDQQIQNFKLNSKTTRMSKQLMFNLIEHLFILNACNTADLIAHLDSLYFCSILDQTDRLQFVIKVKHFSYWHLYRSKKDVKSKVLFHQKILQEQYLMIQDWCIQKIVQLRNQSKEQLNQIIDAVFISWISKKKIAISSSDTRLNTLPPDLRFEFKMEILANECFSCEYLVFISKASEFCQFIRNKQKSKIFFFHFILLERYVYSFYFQQSQQIVDLIRKNLQSEEIMSTLIIEPMLILHLHPQNSAFLRMFYEFLENLNFCNILLQFKLLEKGLAHFYEYRCNYDQQRQLYEKCKQKLKVIVDALDFRKMSAYFYEHLIENHGEDECFFDYSFTFFIKIKVIYSLISKDTYCINKDLKLFIRLASSLSCSNCKYKLKNLAYIEGLNFYIHKLGFGETKPNQIVQCISGQFIRISNELSLLHQQNTQKSQYSSFQQMYCQLQFMFCSLSDEYEMKYEGIKRFYNRFKEKDSISYFLRNSQYQNQFLRSVFRTLKVYFPLEELVYFVNNLSIYLSQSYNIFHFTLLNNQFMIFLQTYSGELNINRFIQLIMKRKNETIQIQALKIIYYNGCLPYLDYEYLNKAITKIPKFIFFLPNSIKRYFQQQLYRFILLFYEKEKAFNRLPFQFKIRKARFIQVKVIKLMKNQAQSGSVIKAKMKSFENFHLKLLAKKALNLGGPYDLDNSKLKCIYVKPSLKKRAI